jgi:fumarylacetoacetate (FAA) hydrolase family protein
MNTSTLPTPCEHALLIGRLWLPKKGPVLVAVTTERVLDLSALALTCSDLPKLRERLSEEGA